MYMSNNIKLHLQTGFPFIGTTISLYTSFREEPINLGTNVQPATPSAVIDREDLVQEVNLAFLLAVRKHAEDETRRGQFARYDDYLEKVIRKNSCVSRGQFRDMN